VKNFIYPRKLQSKGFCQSCSSERQLRRRVADHRVHLVLTLLTLGLWGIAWFSIWRGEQRQPWRCRMCRRPVRQVPSPDEASQGLPLGAVVSGLVVPKVESAGFLPSPRTSPRMR
jgi:hypothetical protein